MSEGSDDSSPKKPLGRASKGNSVLNENESDGDDHTQKKRKKYDQVYRSEWEKDPAFSAWLSACPTDQCFAICRACNAKILARVASIKKHAESYKHQRNASNLSSSDHSHSHSHTQSKIIESSIITKENVPEGSVELLKACATAIERVTAMPEKNEERDPEQREYDAVGVNVGSKLKRMHPTQAIFAEAIINKTLARGLLGSLRDTTDLVDVLNSHVSHVNEYVPS